MEILSSPTGFFNFSSLSSKSNSRLVIKRSQHRFNLLPYHRSSILRVSARFGETSTRRRSSLRKKTIIGDENLRSESVNKPGNDDLVELSVSDGLRDRVSKNSNLLNELEDWVDRYNKEVSYWGIGSNPIFTIYKDESGNVVKVDINEEEILGRKSDLELVSHAKKLAKQMENGENVIHKDSSLVKFVVTSEEKEEEIRFVSSIRKAITRLDLIPKLPAIGKAVLCGYIGLWLLKTLFMMYKKKSNSNINNEVAVVESTELEKEMMRRKMKAWKVKETVEKGSVEVLEMESVSFEKPKFNKEELVRNISKVKGFSKEVELLNSPQVESVESDEKIDEIKAMARLAREIEAGIVLNELDNLEVKSETSIKDESLKIPNQTDEEKTELSGLAVPIVNGSTLDSEEVSNLIQSCDVSDGKPNEMKNRSSRKSRVIRSVEEAKEFLSSRSGEKEVTQEPSQTIAQESDEIEPKQSDEEHEAGRISSGGSQHIEKEQSSRNQKEDYYQELELISEKMRAGFRDNYKAAREKEPQEAGTIAEIQELYQSEQYNDELDWMKDEKLRDIVFLVRDNELAGRDPFHLVDDKDKTMFLQGLEKKVEKENEKLSHLHQWIHSNIENIDYGVDGISVYDPPEKVIPKWKGPPVEKNPEFLDNYNQQREALFSGKAASLSPVRKDDVSSLQDSSQSTTSETTLNQPKIVVEGSDGSIKPGKKSGKEYWQHTKKWSRGFLELYNAETDPEVKAVMKDMGKDLDRWITEDEIKDAANIMEKLPEKNKKFMEKKLNKLKREMELFGPQAVVSKYREYGESKEEDYLWWLDLPHVLCLEMYTVDDKGEQQVGFYTLEMATDLEIEPKPHHVIAFEHAADCRNLCYIIQAHLDMLKTGNVFIIPRPPKDAFREAKANGFGVTVIKKGELKLNIDEPLEEVEEMICEIGSKMYHDKIIGERSVDISSLMKGVFNLKTKPISQRRRRLKRALKNRGTKPTS